MARGAVKSIASGQVSLCTWRRIRGSLLAEPGTWRLDRDELSINFVRMRQNLLGEFHLLLPLDVLAVVLSYSYYYRYPSCLSLMIMASITYHGPSTELAFLTVSLVRVATGRTPQSSVPSAVATADRHSS